MIAISYRRQDSAPVAGRIYDRLQAEFGKGNVFMDFDSIPYGVDFREHIRQTLGRAKVVVAIIGDDWVGNKETRDRRIDEPTDLVRIEVATALEKNIPIIPVLVNKAAMPEASTLPQEIEGLAFRNGLALDSGIDFHHHADRLIAGIHKVVDVGSPAATTASEPRKTTEPRKQLITMLSIIGGIALIGLLLWFVVPGTGISRGNARRQFAAQPASPAASAAEPMPSRPAPEPSATATQSPDPAEEANREYTFSGSIGRMPATLRLRFDPHGHVTGTYTHNGKTYRLDGHVANAQLSLFEYTGEEKTARLELARRVTETELAWEGTMFNISPNTKTMPAIFSRPRRQHE